jgi:hypothetical protein
MFHPATKLVIITEHFLEKKICEVIEQGGGKGYTQVSVGGKGLAPLPSHPRSRHRGRGVRQR